MSAKKVILWEDVNNTVIFYFEKVDSRNTESKMYWELMDINRMEAIFKHCLRCPQISTYNENKIYEWLEKYRNLKITEKTKDMLKK